MTICQFLGFGLFFNILNGQISSKIRNYY